MTENSEKIVNVENVQGNWKLDATMMIHSAIVFSVY